MAAPPFGGKLGGRIAGLVSESTVHTRAKTAKITHDVALQIQHSFFKLVSGEIRDTVGPLFAQVADDPDAPEWVRRTFGFLARGEGQWQAFLAQAVGGQAISAGLGGLINNALAPVVHKIIAKFPNSLIDVGTLAGLVARQKVRWAEGAGEAAAQGINRFRFRDLVEGNLRSLDVGSIITAFNRRLIDRAGATRMLRDNGLNQSSILAALDLRRIPLTPEQAAELENFGVIDRGEGRRIAALSGMRDIDYDKLALGGGQPPATGDLLAAFRRGIINASRLAKGIEQGPVRKEWADVIRDLRFSPPSTEIALSAATQNLLDPGAARRIVAENGTDPKHFAWMLETFGRPLSPEQAGELLNRGILSKAEVRQMFLESNVKNKYVDLVFHLAERLPPMELTVRMVREGAMTRAEAIRNLRQLGFAQRFAVALVDLGTKEKTTATRDLSITTIRELYEGQIIGKADALEALKAHGYDKEEATWLLTIGDVRRERARITAAIGRVRAQFTRGKVTDLQAQTALDRLGVASRARDDLIETWEIERDIAAPQLSVSQIQQALRRGLLEVGDAAQRIAAFGYDEQETTILVSLAVPAPRGG